MSVKRVNPTRVELESLKKKLLVARRGHKLLKDKRDGLMRQFLNLVRKAINLRNNVEKKILQSNKNFALAKASMSKSSIREALMASNQEVLIEVLIKNILGVEIPEFKLSTRVNSQGASHSYGYAFTSCDLDLAVESLSDTVELLVDLANIEKTCQLMTFEIEKTRRRVNALEHVLIPQTVENIKFITMKLSENERSTQVRLLKVKDMILNRYHKYK
ncbi:MAG: V-type ATP synthase subunit D [Oscillospiraceae bacterium]|jgi:V/A-type H+-transporting ATPase subunit D|nr:V-type ATP synthase subunit D [Oscillospiraceae bacterium]